MTTRHKYLEQEILTAPPQKLQLLLIEGAIRSAASAKQLWSEDREQAGEAIVKSQEILAQLLAGLTRDRRDLLVRNVAAVYTFVFRALAIAHLQQNEKSLDDAIRVLEIERETWRQVCQTLSKERSLGLPAAPHFAQLSPHADHDHTSGLSFEA